MSSEWNTHDKKNVTCSGANKDSTLKSVGWRLATCMCLGSDHRVAWVMATLRNQKMVSGLMSRRTFFVFGVC